MSKKNSGVVYAGKVGNNKRIRTRSTTRISPVQKFPFHCMGGPMRATTLYLQADGATLEFAMFGEVGRYINGKWEMSNVRSEEKNERAA